jgi:hypothetical protein
MTTREKVHTLVDELPESQLEPVAEILASRRENGTLDESAKPGDIIDDWGNLDAQTDALFAATMKDLAEEERAAGFGPWKREPSS